MEREACARWQDLRNSNRSADPNAGFSTSLQYFLRVSSRCGAQVGACFRWRGGLGELYVALPKAECWSGARCNLRVSLRTLAELIKPRDFANNTTGLYHRDDRDYLDVR